MLSVEDWAEIRRLHGAKGLPIKSIVRVLGVSRNTVRAAVASDAPHEVSAQAVNSPQASVDRDLPHQPAGPSYPRPA